MASRLARWLVATAAAIVILGASIAPFLAPPVVRFEQDRVGVGTPAFPLTGYGQAALDGLIGALLGDLVLWRDDFSYDVPGDRFGGPVLDDAERAHMRDVRNVFTGFWIVVLAGVVVVAIAFRRARGTEARAAAWQAVANGARALAIVITVLGVVAIAAFDAAFEIFHRLFFSAGTYTFDPATSTLVQLFPDQFWSEIAIAVAVVTLAEGLLTSWIAGRRGHALQDISAPILTATRAGA
jgi:integral membrane protein (TIGR01906 family)